MVIIRKKDGTYGKKYDEVGNLHCGRAWVKKDEKYGYVDQNGDEVIDLVYDRADDFAGGLALVVKDGKYGYIDTEGKEIVPIVNDIENLQIPTICTNVGLDYVYEKADEKFLNLCLQCNRGTI